jgi:hypothetical protein
MNGWYPFVGRCNRWIALYGGGLLNPLEWLKIAYETFGAKYPTASLIGVMFVGALIFGAAWLVGAQQYERSHATQITPSPSSAVPAPSTNTTSGPQSPIMPNNSGSVTITNGEKPDHPPPKE